MHIQNEIILGIALFSLLLFIILFLAFKKINSNKIIAAALSFVIASSLAPVIYLLIAIMRFVITAK